MSNNHLLTNGHTTRIMLVRHGETAWNREERFRGRADVSLNETGLAQAQAPCAISIFEMNGREITLVSLNDTGHLFPGR